MEPKTIQVHIIEKATTVVLPASIITDNALQIEEETLSALNDLFPEQLLPDAS